MLYPTRISTIRAYIYSCMAGEDNTNVFTDDIFLAGCNRFSIENPVPSVSIRCGLYGNSKDVMQHLAEAERKYPKKKFYIEQKQFTTATMGLPQ
jgi:hypothetical protein